jgi:formamidopyrimidine-DNA glycosylase
MTEGPESYFYYSLLKHLKGKYLKKLLILTKRHNRKEFHDLQNELPLKIKQIGIKGKNIWFLFENDMSIFITHGMTGAWRFKGDNDMITKYDIHRLEFIFDNGEHLYFNDWNNIATIRIFYNIDELNNKLDELGPCIFGDTTYDEFYERLNKKKNTNKAIGLLLLDQSIVSGIGNYLRADILWKARISPYRKFKDLSISDKRRLYKYSMSEALRFYKFMKRYDKVFPPQRINSFLVYRKHYDPLGNKVKRDEFEGRSIYWVPIMQK